MLRDLDSAYQALKSHEGGSGRAEVDVDLEAYRDAAVNALAEYTARCVKSRADKEGSGEDGAHELYKQVSPRAMVAIALVVSVIGDLVDGEGDQEVNEFLSGLAYGQA